MKKSLFVLGLAVLSVTAPAAHAVGILTISEVYGGGGNTGAPFTNDFIEIFNPSTTVSVDLMGYSVQYNSATGTGAYQVTPLSAASFLLAPQSYFLVREAAGTGTGTMAAPTPDATGSINLSATTGKVALVNNATALAATAAANAAGIVDFIGFGTANVFEGMVAPAGSNTLSLQRAGTPSGQTDTDNNSMDFSALSPRPTDNAGMTATVPEPSTYAMMAGGLGLLMLGQRVRRHATGRA